MPPLRGAARIAVEPTCAQARRAGDGKRRPAAAPGRAGRRPLRGGVGRRELLWGCKPRQELCDPMKVFSQAARVKGVWDLPRH
eukprot:353206-Chlamydomonas_euryale.AAC.2